MPGSWIDDQVWGASGQILNAEGAIYKYWRSLRADGVYLGLPVTPEVQTEIGTQQGFSSGRVISWSADDGVSLADDN